MSRFRIFLLLIGLGANPIAAAGDAQVAGVWDPFSYTPFRDPASISTVVRNVSGTVYFDGDITLCLSKENLTVQQVPGGWPGGFAAHLKVLTDTGTYDAKPAGLGEHKIGEGMWQFVMGVGDLHITNVKRLEKGNPPDISVAGSCAVLVDGAGERPGMVKFSLFVPVLSDPFVSGDTIRAPSFPQVGATSSGGGSAGKQRVLFDDYAPKRGTASPAPPPESSRNGVLLIDEEVSKSRAAEGSPAASAAHAAARPEPVGTTPEGVVGPQVFEALPFRRSTLSIDKPR